MDTLARFEPKRPPEIMSFMVSFVLQQREPETIDEGQSWDLCLVLSCFAPVPPPHPQCPASLSQSQLPSPVDAGPLARVNVWLFPQF